METDYGTAVARTRKFYGVSTGNFDAGLTWATHDQENRGIKTRTSRAGTIVREAPTLKLADIDGIGYDDLVLPFSMGLEGGQTGAGGDAAKTWQFTAQNAATGAYESACADFGDDVQNYTLAGLTPTSWTISAAAGESTHFTMDLVGTTTVKGAATALANVQPVYIPGGLWTLKHATAFADLGAASVVTCFLRSFSLTWNPGILQQFYLSGSLSACQTSESWMEGTLEMTVDATALAVSEYYDKWRAGTLDFVRLMATGPALGGANYALGFDMPVYWGNVQPISAEVDGINQYAVTGNIAYGTTATKSLEANLVCSLAAIP